MRKMKDSGVEWLGKTPQEWEIVRFKSCVSERDGGSWGEEPQGNSNDVICMRIADFDYSSFRFKDDVDYTIRNYRQNTIDKLKLKKGDILIEKSGGGEKTPVGRAVLFDKNHDALFANFMDRIRTRNNTLAEYFLYVLAVFYSNNYVWNYIKQTTGIQNLDLSTMLAIEKLSLPSIAEQKRIADYLDSKCAKIDSIIANQEQIIEKLKEYKLSLITEAVTKGLDPNVEMKDSGVEWIGEIPSSWEVFKLANLYFQTAESGRDDLPILTVSINSGISDKELDDDEQDRVFVRSEDRSKYKRVQPGDLAYNMMRAWQGAFGAARVEGMVSPAYVTCRAKKGVNIDTRYIEYLLRTPIATEEMHRYSHGIADFRLRLYWPEFRNIKICLPSYEDQTLIADYIDYKSSMIENELNKRIRIIDQMKEYKKSLIYEVVTGKKEIIA